MRAWQKIIISSILSVWLAISGVSQAETLPELKKIISDQLLYPREARYIMQSILPSDTFDKAKNSEWLSVAHQLGKIGLIRLSNVSGKTILDGTEQSLDVVVPSMNFRYETTALNVVLGRWDIEVVKAANVNGVVVVYGKRRLTKRSRAHDLIVGSIPSKEAMKYADQDMLWEISRNGSSFNVVEKIK